MSKTTVIYGSTTGTTEAAAAKIAEAFGAEAVNVNDAGADALAADLLVLGVPTWGVGDLQDDWAARLDALRPAFAGKKVAVFGLGDSIGFADTFCAAAQTLADAAAAAGATPVGGILRLDETNESDKTAARIAEWIAKVKAEAGIQ